MLGRLSITLVLGLFLFSCSGSKSAIKKSPVVENVDMDATLQIAVVETHRPGINKSLGIWVIRDQEINAEQAKIVSELYLSQIDDMTIPFNIWHASWAISNLYRQGNTEVQAALQTAYDKAKVQPNRLKGFQARIANTHINGDKISTGFIHGGGRAYARGHMVVPGNTDYLQSFDQYLAKVRK